MKKRLLSVLLLAVLLMTGIQSALAGYDDIAPVVGGWNMSTSKSSDVKLGSKTVGGCSNLQNAIPAFYQFTSTFTHTITFGGELKTELSNEISATTGVAEGKFGTKITATFNISENYVRSYQELFSQTVPKFSELTLYSDKYGTKVTLYAKHFVAWVETYRGSGTVSTPEYQKYRPVLIKKVN